MKQKRIYNGCLFIFFTLIEVYIALFVVDNFIRPYVGDILVVFVIYFFIKTWFPQRITWFIPMIFAFAILVECLQYINILQIVGLDHISFLRILVGTTFSWADIICYGLGCVLLWIYEYVYEKLLNKRVSAP